MGLEQLKPPEVNEIILHADDGALLEGTQTNFYVIRHGKVGSLRHSSQGLAMDSRPFCSSPLSTLYGML